MAGVSITRIYCHFRGTGKNITILDSFDTLRFREKLYAETSDNPLVDAIKTQCPKLAFDLGQGDTQLLNGEEILHILCEEKCERLQESKPLGKY